MEQIAQVYARSLFEVASGHHEFAFAVSGP